MFAKLKDLLIGPALPTQTMGQKQLNKVRALAAFSPDALSVYSLRQPGNISGVDCGRQPGLTYAWPIGLAITGVLVIVAISYFQTIHGYPSGAVHTLLPRSNLGVLPG